MFRIWLIYSNNEFFLRSSFMNRLGESSFIEVTSPIWWATSPTETSSASTAEASSASAASTSGWPTSTAESSCSSASSPSCWSRSCWFFDSPSFNRQKVFRIHEQYMSFFKSVWRHSFCRFDAKVEAADWTQNLIYSSNFSFWLKIHSSIEFRHALWISAFYNEIVLRAMHVGSIRDDKRWRALIHHGPTSSSTSSASSASTSSSATSCATRSSAIVVLVELFSHNYYIKKSQK